MDLLTSKLISLTLLGCLSLFFGLIPLKVQKRLMKSTGAASEAAQRRQRLKRELIVSCLLCFGAGVLMATVFLHMLPETRENVELTRATLSMSEITERRVMNENGTHFQSLKLGHDHDEHGHDHDEHGHDHDEHGHDHGEHGHDEHGHDHGEHGHVHKRSVDSPSEEIKLSTTTEVPETTTNSLLNQDSDHSHDHAGHSHDHDDHSHDHDDHSHDHADHSHNHADHSHDHADHSHDHADHSDGHSEPASPSLLSDGTDSPPTALPTVSPVIEEEMAHDHDHDHGHDHADHSHDHADHSHDHADHSHADHANENHDDMSSSTPPSSSSSTDSTSFTEDADFVTEVPNSDQSQRDHKGHLHDHELTHGPYDRTHDNLEYILKPSKMDDSRSLSFVPHDHSHDGHSHDDHDHSSHADHDHEETNARLQNFDTDHLENGTHEGHGKHDPASPIKVHVHDDHHGHHHHGHDHGEAHPYPIAELLICMGFFLIYFIEEVVHKVVFHQHQRSHSKRDSKGGAGSMVLTNRNSSLAPSRDSKRTSSVASNGVEGIFRPAGPHTAENGHVISNGYTTNDSATSNGALRNGSTSSVGSLAPRAQWGTTGVDNPVFACDGETDSPQIIKESDLFEVPLDSPILGLEKSSSSSAFDFGNNLPDKPHAKQPGYKRTRLTSESEVQFQLPDVGREDAGQSSNPEGAESEAPSHPVYDTMGNTIRARSFQRRRHSSPIIPQHLRLQMASIDYTNNTSPGHGHSHMVDFNKLKASDWVSSLRSLIVVVALSFHAVFEGLAVGLQQQLQDVWYLFYAIAAHKLVIAFCVGLELIAGGTRTALTVVYMVVFALVTPLGIAIGIIITEGTDEPNSLSHRWTLTILQGVAGGTILYVTFCEVLERERGRKEGRFLKLAALIVGFTTMAVIEAVGGHKHSH